MRTKKGLESSIFTTLLNMFNFNKLIELYNTDLEWGRIYLYENLMVLCTKELLAGIHERHHEDIISDIYMKIDEWIQASMEKWYSNKQIYCYIKLRVSGFIINYFKFDISKHHIETSYIWDEDINDKEYNIDEMMNLNQIPTLLLDWMMLCTPLEARAVMLHYYMWMPVKQIEKLTWYSKVNIYRRLNSGIKKLKKFLESKWVWYEDLCKR